VKISSDNSHLYFVADAFLHPVYVDHTEWHLSVAYDFKKITASRNKLIEETASGDTHVITTTSPSPGWVK
jgi:hypothetical protein